MSTWPWEAILSAIVAFAGAVGVLVRYVMKVERSFSDQRVINTKTVGALDLITEKLNGQGELTASKQADLERRVGDLEHGVAPRHAIR